MAFRSRPNASVSVRAGSRYETVGMVTMACDLATGVMRSSSHARRHARKEDIR
jgi:hypothetical protein